MSFCNWIQLERLLLHCYQSSMSEFSIRAANVFFLLIWNVMYETWKILTHGSQTKLVKEPFNDKKCCDLTKVRKRLVVMTWNIRNSLFAKLTKLNLVAHNYSAWWPIVGVLSRLNQAVCTRERKTKFMCKIEKISWRQSTDSKPPFLVIYFFKFSRRQWKLDVLSLYE